MFAIVRFASSVSRPSRSTIWPVRSTYSSRMVKGPSRQVRAARSSSGRQQAAQLGAGSWTRSGGPAGHRATETGAVGGRPSRRRRRRGRPPPRVGRRLDLQLAGLHDLVDDVDEVPAVVARPCARPAASPARPGATARPTASARAPRPRAGRRWRAGSAPGRGSPASRTATGRRRPVRDALLAQPGDDRLAVLVLAVEDREAPTSGLGRPRSARAPSPPAP